jgi:hypothetical protein
MQFGYFDNAITITEQIFFGSAFDVNKFGKSLYFSKRPFTLSPSQLLFLAPQVKHVHAD